MKITSLDRAAVKSLRDEMSAALKAVAARHGIEITVGNASFSHTNAKFSVALAVKDKRGKVLSAEAEAFKRHAERFGLVPEDLNKSFKYADRKYTITGCLPRSRRYPILARRDDGTTVKFNAKMVSNAIIGQVLSGK